MIDDRTGGKDLCKLVNQLTDDIGDLVTKKRAELNSLWSLERARKPGKTRERKITFMRRGIGKYLLLQPPYSTALTPDGRLRADTPKQVPSSARENRAC